MSRARRSSLTDSSVLAKACQISRLVGTIRLVCGLACTCTSWQERGSGRADPYSGERQLRTRQLEQTVRVQGVRARLVAGTLPCFLRSYSTPAGLFSNFRPVVRYPGKGSNMLHPLVRSPTVSSPSDDLYLSVPLQYSLPTPTALPKSLLKSSLSCLSRSRRSFTAPHLNRLSSICRFQLWSPLGSILPRRLRRNLDRLSARHH